MNDTAFRAGLSHGGRWLCIFQPSVLTAALGKSKGTLTIQEGGMNLQVQACSLETGPL
jgi:hypothetical protein